MSAPFWQILSHWGACKCIYLIIGLLLDFFCACKHPHWELVHIKDSPALVDKLIVYSWCPAWRDLLYLPALSECCPGCEPSDSFTLLLDCSLITRSINLFPTYLFFVCSHARPPVFQFGSWIWADRLPLGFVPKAQRLNYTLVLLTCLSWSLLSLPINIITCGPLAAIGTEAHLLQTRVF